MPSGPYRAEINGGLVLLYFDMGSFFHFGLHLTRTIIILVMKLYQILEYEDQFHQAIKI